MEPFGGTKYLWGNMPAIDIVKLQQNEGVDYDKKLQLLFAGGNCHVLLVMGLLTGT